MAGGGACVVGGVCVWLVGGVHACDFAKLLNEVFKANGPF